MNAASLFRRVPGVVVAVLGALALRFATAAPLGTRTAADEVAQVRLSLSARPERISKDAPGSFRSLVEHPTTRRLRLLRGQFYE